MSVLKVLEALSEECIGSINRAKAMEGPACEAGGAPELVFNARRIRGATSDWYFKKGGNRSQSK